MPDAPLFLDFPFPLNWWQRRNQSKAFPSKTADIFLESLDSTPMLLLPDLRQMVRDAVQCHFHDAEQMPKIIRLHFVRDEVLSV